MAVLSLMMIMSIARSCTVGRRPLPICLRTPEPGARNLSVSSSRCFGIDDALIDLTVELGEYGDLEGAGWEEYPIGVVVELFERVQMLGGDAYFSRYPGDRGLYCGQVQLLRLVAQRYHI